MRKILAVTILVLAGSGCVAQNGSGCIMLVPHTDQDPEGIIFERFSEKRGIAYGNHVWGIENGEVLGFSAAEDAAIWNKPECVTYSDDL